MIEITGAQSRELVGCRQRAACRVLLLPYFVFSSFSSFLLLRAHARGRQWGDARASLVRLRERVLDCVFGQREHACLVLEVGRRALSEDSGVVS